MEAKTKIMAAVAVIVMCAAGLVGAGYAYTASTENSGNTATSEYVTITQDGVGKYTFVEEQHIYYNSQNTKTGTTYTLDNARNDINASYDLIKLGKTFTLVTTKAGNDSTENVTCKITLGNTSQVTLAGGYVLAIKTQTAKADTAAQWVVYNGSTGADVGEFTIYGKTTTAYHSTTVEVFYGLAHNAKATEAPVAKPINDATFNFTIEMPGHNTFEVSGITNLTVGHKLSDVTCTVTCDGDELTKTTQYTIAWKDANGDPIETPASEDVVSGTHYFLCISGVAASGYENHYAEYEVVGAPAS